MVNHNYVLFVIFLFVSLVISHIDCEGRVSIMTVPVSTHCLPSTIWTKRASKMADGGIALGHIMPINVRCKTIYSSNVKSMNLLLSRSFESY